MQENQEQTFGEKRIRVSFNPSKDNIVDKIKTKYAELIDLLEEHRRNVQKEYESQPISYAQSYPNQTMRLISEAQTSAEVAAMWAVKAVTGKN